MADEKDRKDKDVSEEAIIERRRDHNIGPVDKKDQTVTDTHKPPSTPKPPNDEEDKS